MKNTFESACGKQRRVSRNIAITALVACVCLSISTALAQSNTPEKGASSRRIEPRTISMRVKNRPASDVLKALAKKTGNDAQLVDDFGRPANELLSKKVTFQVKKAPFWTVMSRIEQLTGTTFVKLRDGSAHFSVPSDFNAIGREPSIGTPVVQGSIRLVPRYNKFFDHVEIDLQPEPRLGRFEPGESRLTITPKKGEPFEVEQHGLSQVNGISNCVKLSYSLKKGRETMALDAIDGLRARGHVLHVESEEKSLGTISQLLKSKKAVQAGLVEVKVKNAGEKELEGGRKVFFVELDTEGARVLPTSFRLVGRGKDSHDLVGGSARPGKDGLRSVELQFEPEEVGKNAASLKLTLDAPLKIAKVPVDATFDKLHAPRK